MNEEGSPRDVRWRRCGKGTGGEGRKRKTEEKGKVEIGRRNGRGGWKPLAERAERKIEGRKIRERRERWQRMGRAVQVEEDRRQDTLRGKRKN